MKKAYKTLKTTHLWSSKNIFLYARLSSPFFQLLLNSRRFLHWFFSHLLLGFNFFLPLLIAATILINLSAPRLPFDQIKEQVLSHPQDPQLHLLLAQQLFTANQLPASLRQYRLALASTSLTDKQKNQIEKQIKTIAQLQNQPTAIKTNIEFWSQLTKLLPFYRDAYIKLAILNWKIYKLSEAKQNLETALSLDPNNQEIKKIQLSLTD